MYFAHIFFYVDEYWKFDLYPFQEVGETKQWKSPF